MVELFHDFHFTFDALPAVGFHEFNLLVDLHGYLLIEHFVEAQSHDGIGTLADPLSDEIVVQVLDRAICRAEFDDFLVGLTLTLVHLRFIQRMSIINFASVLRCVLLDGRGLGLQRVSHSIDVPCLNCGRFCHN